MPTALEPSVGSVRDVAHVYYNVSSGERVVTLLRDGQTVPGDTVAPDSSPIWSALVGNPCADQGYTTSYFFGFDNPGSTSLSTAITLSDYGDIGTDTVIDCFRVNWVVAHADTDADGDGIGDGVVGLGAEWGVWDLDNGRAANQCDRVPLIMVQLTDLPGNVLGAGSLSGYTLDLDLRSAVDGEDQTFEICDTDGDPQGASFHYPFIGTFDHNFDGFPDSDLDGDGLADWGWTVRFYQPGTTDFDGDGVPDGVPAPSDADTIGVSIGAPDGTAINNPDGTWTWEIDVTTTDPGTGQEDRFAIYNPDGSYNGGYFLGGFACDGDAGYTPPAMFAFQLFGPAAVVCCCLDLNEDGVLNFFDVSLFIQWYSTSDPGADYNDDGAIDFFDVSLFVQDFNAGCP